MHKLRFASRIKGQRYLRSRLFIDSARISRVLASFLRDDHNITPVSGKQHDNDKRRGWCWLWHAFASRRPRRPHLKKMLLRNSLLLQDRSAEAVDFSFFGDWGATCLPTNPSLHSVYEGVKVATQVNMFADRVKPTLLSRWKITFTTMVRRVPPILFKKICTVVSIRHWRPLVHGIRSWAIMITLELTRHKRRLIITTNTRILVGPFPIINTHASGLFQVRNKPWRLSLSTR